MNRATYAEDGFWGTVMGGLTEGVAKVASDVLPVWVNSQIKKDTPANPISAPQPSLGNIPINTAPQPSLGNIPISTAPSNGPVISSFLDAGSVTLPAIPANTMMAGGIILLGLIIIFMVK